MTHTRTPHCNVPSTLASPLGSVVAVVLLGVLLAACGAPPVKPAEAPKACDAASFTALNLDRAKIVSATAVPAGSYTPPGATPAQAGLPAFCVVKGEAAPTADSLIRFEVWVPQGSAWNGKLVATGNGGYSPTLSYGDMAYAMRQGYAAIGGDTGHQAADGNDMTWGVGHPEKIVDWGTRSVSAITAPGKRIVAQLQGRPATRAYYYGCSTGGHQAYAEVQTYPQDFDGVIAGAPGNNRVALNAEFLWRYLSAREARSNTLVLTPAKAQLLGKAAVAACDTLDGVADGVVADPRACTSDHFKPESLQCAGADAPDCLTAAQVSAVKKIYEGPKNPRTGTQIYPGQVVGTEAGWPSYWGAATPVRADFWRLWVYNTPTWDAWGFDFDGDLAVSLAKTGPMVDHVNPDISAFKARGGKLIAFQGWADPVVSGVDTIAYYDKVRALQGSQAATDSFFRLFMAPGMDHCRGGPGANVFGNAGVAAPEPSAQNDLLMALDRWVEQDTAPERLIAARVTNGVVTQTRPLCAYPKTAVYNGSGSTDDAASFVCR